MLGEPREDKAAWEPEAVEVAEPDVAEVVAKVAVSDALICTLSNRRRRPHDGNRKRDISLEMSVRMYNTTWRCPEVENVRTWGSTWRRKREYLIFCFDPF